MGNKNSTHKFIKDNHWVDGDIELNPSYFILHFSLANYNINILYNIINLSGQEFDIKTISSPFNLFSTQIKDYIKHNDIREIQFNPYNSNISGTNILSINKVKLNIKDGLYHSVIDEINNLQLINYEQTIKEEYSHIINLQTEFSEVNIIIGNLTDSYSNDCLNSLADLFQYFHIQLQKYYFNERINIINKYKQKNKDTNNNIN